MGYIAFRIFTNALQACRGDQLQVWRVPDSEEHRFIMAVRRGENGEIGDLLAKAEQREREVRKALKSSALVEKLAADFLQPWLAEVMDWRNTFETNVRVCL